MHELMVAVIGALLVGPLQAHLAELLAAAPVPEALMRGAADCVSRAGPAIAERFADDPWWAAVAGVRLWLGYADPIALLAEAAPACAPALRSAGTFIASIPS